MGYIAREVVVGTVLPPIIPSSIKLVPVVLSLLGAYYIIIIYRLYNIYIYIIYIYIV